MVPISYSPCSPTVYWIDGLKLPKSDEKRLARDQELNDRILMGMAHIFQMQFPELPPMQDTGYAVKLQKLRPATEGSMYFHNYDGHWSLSQLSGGSVDLYDSLQAKFIGSTLKEQLVALYGDLAEDGELTVSQHQVQLQKGSTDCGLFAVAFATSILLGDQPSSLQYKQKEMRGHLTDCLQNQLMIPFPAVSKKSLRQPQPLKTKLKL